MNKATFYMPLVFAIVLIAAAFGVLALAPDSTGRSTGSAESTHGNNAGEGPTGDASQASVVQADHPASPSGTNPNERSGHPGAVKASSAAAASPAVRPREYNLHPKTVFYKEKVLVLMYHHIDDKESMVTIAPNKFRDHLKAIRDSQYNVISMEDYIAFMKNGTAVPPNAVVITFDDGYESFYTKAFPALLEFGMVATNFVVVSYVDTDYPRLPFLTWKQIREMKKAGMSFYSHSYDLHHKKPDASGQDQPAMTSRVKKPRANRLEKDTEYRERVVKDLLLAEDQLRAHLGEQESVLCFPFGAYSGTVVQLAHDIGIEYVVTIKEGINTRENREIYRLNAGVPYMSAEGLINRMKRYK